MGISIDESDMRFGEYEVMLVVKNAENEWLAIPLDPAPHAEKKSC